MPAPAIAGGQSTATAKVAPWRERTQRSRRRSCSLSTAACARCARPSGAWRSCSPTARSPASSICRSARRRSASASRRRSSPPTRWPRTTAATATRSPRAWTCRASSWRSWARQRGLLRRPRRLDARRRHGGRHARRQRHRRCRDADRGRQRAGASGAPHRASRRRLLRRRRDGRGRLARELQYGGAVEAAGPVRVREQRLVGILSGVTAACHRGAGGLPRPSGSRRRAWTATTSAPSLRCRHRRGRATSATATAPGCSNAGRGGPADISKAIRRNTATPAISRRSAPTIRSPGPPQRSASSVSRRPTSRLTESSGSGERRRCRRSGPGRNGADARRGARGVYRVARGPGHERAPLRPGDQPRARRRDGGRIPRSSCSARTSRAPGGPFGVTRGLLDTFRPGSRTRHADLRGGASSVPRSAPP